MASLSTFLYPSPIVDIEKVRGETTAGGVYSNCYFHLCVWLLYQVERVTKFFHLYFYFKKKKKTLRGIFSGAELITRRETF